MPVVHHQTFKLADMPQARLLTLAEEVERVIKDPKYDVQDVNNTGHLIAATYQIIGQAEVAALITGREALEHAKQVVKCTDGVQDAQIKAPVNGEPAQAVTAANIQILAVLRSILNKVSALKTKLALQQFNDFIAKKEKESGQ